MGLMISIIVIEISALNLSCVKDNCTTNRTTRGPMIRIVSVVKRTIRVNMITQNTRVNGENKEPHDNESIPDK